MTGSRVVYIGADGSTCIGTPAAGVDVEAFAKMTVPEGTTYQIVDESTLEHAGSYPLDFRKFYGNEKLNLFTQSEQLTVVTATLSDPVVKLMYDRLLGAAYLTYEDPETEQGLALLVSKGLLTVERKAEITAALQAKTQ